MPQDRSAAPSEVLAPPQRVRRHVELLAVAALGLVVGLNVRGHFAKPHNDFYQFRETGRHLLRGELPETFKRAPLFPLVVAAGGMVLERALPVELDKHPDVLAGEWINVLLLPLNCVLVVLVGRRWLGGGAVWAAAWFALLPMGMYCTAHAIAEPLLVTTILLTVLAAQRGSRWVYAAAAAASLTRYDAAGALVAVVVVDLVARRGPWPAALRAAAACVPLAIWLGLTAATWQQRSHDHYLEQMAERPEFRPLWALQVPVQSVFDFENARLRLPAPIADAERPLKQGVAAALALLAVVGCGSLLRRRDAGAIVVGVVFLTYTLVHAAFPFRELRFGYPLAAFLLLMAGAGVVVLRPYGSRAWNALGSGRTVILLTLGVVLGWMVLRGTEPFMMRGGQANPWAVSLPVLAALAIVAVWTTPLAERGGYLPRVVLLLAGVELAFVQVAAAVPMFGWGGDMKNIVESARWVARNVPAEQRVLSAEPGVLRLYAGLDPRDRFLGFEQIEAGDWPGVVAECREHGVGYIVWHDQQFAEHGGHYAEKMGLTRFDVLAHPEDVPEVRVEAFFANYPSVWVFRIVD